MTWKECGIVSLREEFVALASSRGANRSLLCRRFGISRKTGYKWLKRAEGGGSMLDRSRRPHRSPARTPASVASAVLAVREAHPAWGGRKIRAVLRRGGGEGVPAASTITAILHRAGRIDPAQSQARQGWQRFEHRHPNDLWQMDFKGHFALVDGSRCHPLTVLDDHSRYNLALRACVDEQHATVQAALRQLFRCYGLPRRMLMDNGAPWGNGPEQPLTRLGVWLLRLEIAISHGRPYHPQTQGKDERFHRTLQLELLRDQAFDDPRHTQDHFDRFRHTYNHDRPHEALGLATPAERYTASPRSFPESLPPIVYPPGDIVRKVQQGGWISYRGRPLRLPKALHGEPVALRPTAADGVLAVVYASHELGTLDLTESEPRLARGGSGRCAPSTAAGEGDRPTSHV